MDLIKFAADGLVIIAFISAGGSIVYWLIKSKISEEFLSKDSYNKNCDYHIKSCDSKHLQIENHISTVKSEVSEDIKEIKQMVREITAWLMNGGLGRKE